jgi:hypothetical protein
LEANSEVHRFPLGKLTRSWPGQTVGVGHLCYAARNSAISRLSALAEPRLENYAVIDNVNIEFASGLVLLTGEAGAGKSKAAWSIHFPGLSFSGLP